MAAARMVLRDGRRLAWREYGLADGFPIVFSHGNLNSRLFAPSWDMTDAITKKTGVRLIAVDRPGYGDSDFLKVLHSQLPTGSLALPTHHSFLWFPEGQTVLVVGRRSHSAL